jgi:hypothetical protein
MPEISPSGAVKVAVTVDDFVLWDGVPMPEGITPLGLRRRSSRYWTARSSARRWSAHDADPGGSTAAMSQDLPRSS